MQIVSNDRDNLHDLSKQTYFLGKIEKNFKISSAEIFTRDTISSVKENIFSQCGTSKKKKKKKKWLKLLNSKLLKRYISWV